MITHQYKQLFFLVFFCSLNSTVNALDAFLINRALTERKIELDASITNACNEYLSSKGFNNFILVTIDDDHFWGDDGYFGGEYTFNHAYAFTIPERYSKIIFLSPMIIKSIQERLGNKQPISVYDRFTLLHELGHLHPYGLECDKLEVIVAIYSVVAYISSMLTFGMSQISARNHELFIFCMCGLGITATAYSAAFYIYQTKVLPIKNKSKKWVFKHDDLKYEKYVKSACEEQDADHFAFALLSAEELKELYEYLKSLPPVMKQDENAYHPTIGDECSDILAELKKRRICIS